MPLPKRPDCRVLTLAVVLCVLFSQRAQAAELLITQYYEGANNDRWVELTNVSATAIDLASYRLGLWADTNAEGYKSGAAPSAAFALSGTLAPGASQLFKHSAAVQPSYAASQWSGGAGSPADFTGNDSLALYTGTPFQTANVIDAIGFTASGNEGADTSFVRLSTGAGWSTAADSRATGFPGVWKQYALAAVNTASAGTQQRLGTASPSPLPNGVAGWQLQFEDDFGGSRLDGTKWRLGGHAAYMSGDGGISPSNVAVSGGNLRLKAEQRSVSFSGQQFAYATGAVSTFFQYRQQYGYFEARVRYPAVTGLWPSFWLMPDRGEYGWRDEYHQSYLKFDLTGASLSQVSSAVLKLTVSAVESGGPENNLVFMKLEDDSWSESTLTWNNKPAPDPVWLEQRWNSQLTPGQVVSVDVTGFVQQQVAGDRKVSLVVADTYLRTKYIKFHSREAAVQAQRPQLVINGVTYYATADTHVRWGDHANTNHGTAPELTVQDDWGDTATTYNGGMEIDIMESLGIWGPDKTSHALHWDGYWADHKSKGWGPLAFAPRADGFHVYGLYWQQGRLEFYVDGTRTAEWTDARIASVPAYLLLYHQLGGWDGNTPGPQVHNQQMEVDWVRAWSATQPAPQTVQLTVQTSPPGLQVVFDGTAGTAPLTRTVAVGSTHTIGAPSPQGGLDFQSWSDGGAREHTLTAGSANATYTATFADTAAGGIDAAFMGGVVYPAVFADKSGTQVTADFSLWGGTWDASRKSFEWDVTNGGLTATHNRTWDAAGSVVGTTGQSSGDRQVTFTVNALPAGGTLQLGLTNLSRPLTHSLGGTDSLGVSNNGEVRYNGFQLGATVAPFTTGDRVTLRYKEGKAYVRVNGGPWNTLVCPVGQYRAEYFNNPSLGGAPVLQRCEPAPLAYDWGTGTPAPWVSTDGFSVRWTGQFQFTAGTHTFTARADDGVRVFVDGTPLINAWWDQAPTTYQASRTLTAGTHTVVMEYYENSGGAVAQLSW